jgi:5'-nucleotidase
MIVLVDMDGVLANFVEGFRQAWKNKGFPGLDEWKNWNMSHHIPESHHHLIDPVMFEEGLFANLPVIPGAQQAIQEIVADGHVVFVCSTPAASDHCTTEKTAWLRRHFGPEIARKAIFTHDKTVVRGDILIDDKPEITGVLEPYWRHVVFDCPYNQHVTDRSRLTRWEDWREVVRR